MQSLQNSKSIPLEADELGPEKLASK